MSKVSIHESIARAAETAAVAAPPEVREALIRFAAAVRAEADDDKK